MCRVFYVYSKSNIKANSRFLKSQAMLQLNQDSEFICLLGSEDYFLNDMWILRLTNLEFVYLKN